MFFLDHPELMVTESMKRNAIEEIENSISWLRANLERIDGWATLVHSHSLISENQSFVPARD